MQDRMFLVRKIQIINGNHLFIRHCQFFRRVLKIRLIKNGIPTRDVIIPDGKNNTSDKHLA